MGCLPRKAVDYMWNQPKGKKCVTAKRSWRSEKHPIIIHGNAQFRVCPAVFQLLVQYSFYAIPPFVHPLPYMLNICYLSLILILQGNAVNRLHWFQKRLKTLDFNSTDTVIYYVGFWI